MSALSDLHPVLAQAAAPAASSPNGGPMILIFYALMAGALYFLFIAPQRKKQKAQEAMMKSLKTGDDILTTGGIFGTITNVKDDRFIVRISDTAKIEVAKGFVQSVVKKADEESKA